MIAGNFESGSAEMKSSSQAAFDRIAALLRQRNCRVRIEGHTDNVPIHNAQFSSNWELSTSRATEIVRLLIVRDGYSPELLSAAGYAEYHPVTSNATADGRSTNRRVDIVVLSQDAAAGASRFERSAASGPSPFPAPQIAPAALPAEENKLAKPSPVVASKPAVTTAGTPRQ